MAIRTKIWTHSLIIMCLFTIACSDESPAPKTEWLDPLVFGTYLTDACGVGTSNYDRVEWEHNLGGGSTLHLNKAQGCGVYEGAIEFTPRPEQPHLATWKVQTQMCNRCVTPRYLKWMRLRAESEGGTSLEVPEGDLLSFGDDWDEVEGPELGDGLSGFIRYRDTSGAEYLTQCFVWPLIDNNSDGGFPLGPMVHQRELSSGEWVRTQVGWSARMLFDEGRFADGYESNRPVDFAHLAAVEYLWPRMHAAPSNRTGNFPVVECKKLGFEDSFFFRDEVVGGVLEQDRGYRDWIPQAFEFQLNEPFHSQLFGLSSTWTAGQSAEASPDGL